MHCSDTALRKPFYGQIPSISLCCESHTQTSTECLSSACALSVRGSASCIWMPIEVHWKPLYQIIQSQTGEMKLNDSTERRVRWGLGWAPVTGNDSRLRLRTRWRSQLTEEMEIQMGRGQRVQSRGSDAREGGLPSEKVNERSTKSENRIYPLKADLIEVGKWVTTASPLNCYI